MAEAIETAYGYKASVKTRLGGVVMEVLLTARRVTYEFDTSATNVDLVIPYAIAVNGKALPHYDAGPEWLDRDPKNRKIEIAVRPGSTVALFLNSDAHPKHRQCPVYAVKVDDADAYVLIKEIKGRNIGHLSATVGSPVREKHAEHKEIDRYKASLTGDIWKQISHAYTAEEAASMLPDDLDPAIRAAVCRIYASPPKDVVRIDFPASDSAKGSTLKIVFMGEMKNNALENTTACSWPADILPRVHPRAYAALIEEAKRANIKEVHATSGWRPCLGSIAHRAGLGLDINYVDDGGVHLTLNRASLASPKHTAGSNVTERESELWAPIKGAYDASTKLGAKVKQLRAKLRLSKSADEKANLEKEIRADDDAIRRHNVEQVEAKEPWEAEMKAREPSLIRTLRSGLCTNTLVTQVLDPWYVELNTRDKLPPVANVQLKEIERIHNNHLHITINEPGILP